MTTLLIHHPIFAAHDTGPGHPERPDRIRAVEKVLAEPVFSALTRAEAPLRDDIEEQLALAHTTGYIDAIRNASPAAGRLVRLDPDTVMSNASWEAALRAVGAGLHAVDAVVGGDGKVRNAFCAVRPPGHHAESQRVTGFCLFSNAAIAGLYARKVYGLERIAVVDFDVHHGNGTQEIFWSDKDLFYGSTHQMPLYPGTGAVGETGVGNIFNAPLRAGDDGAVFRTAFDARILPALEDFKPDLVIVSAGFDAHAADPLAGLRLIEDDFAWATGRLLDIADKHCRGRLVSMLEGGYDLKALAGSVAAHVRMLMQA
jgi:acetoin utilization deacetylase AcuC-like enzyme